MIFLRVHVSCHPRITSDCSHRCHNELWRGTVLHVAPVRALPRAYFRHALGSTSAHCVILLNLCALALVSINQQPQPFLQYNPLKNKIQDILLYLLRIITSLKILSYNNCCTCYCPGYKIVQALSVFPNLVFFFFFLISPIIICKRFFRT